MSETRHTFTIPPGFEAVRDHEGRATGEIRPAAPATAPQGELVERLIAAIRLGEATGSRGRAASNIYNLADEAAALIQSQATEIERLTEELRVSDLEGSAAFALAVDDPGKNPPVAWKDRAETAEADLARAREALEKLSDAADAMGTAANMSMADDAISFARAALPNTTGEAE